MLQVPKFASILPPSEPNLLMKIDPTLLTQCADAGGAAAYLINPFSGLVHVMPGSPDQMAREAFAQAVIDIIVPAIDTSFGPLSEYLIGHPDVPEGELLSDATLRLLKERDVVKARLAQLEWRPVSEKWSPADGYRVLALSRDESVREWPVAVCAASFVSWEAFGVAFSHWMPLSSLPPDPDAFTLWWAQATEDQRRDAARAGREGGAQ